MNTLLPAQGGGGGGVCVARSLCVCVIGLTLFSLVLVPR